MASLSLVPLADSDTPPDEPITLDEAKQHCRIELDVTDDDALITGYIAASREHAQNVTGRQFVAASYRLTLDCWPCWIDVPRAPLRSVTSITYLDADGATQTLATNQYRVNAPTGPTAARGTIEPAYGVSWPGLYSVSDCVTVTFSAGYGSSADSVPQAIKMAMLQLIGHWYLNREPVIVGTSVIELPMSVKSLLLPFKTWARQAA